MEPGRRWEQWSINVNFAAAEAYNDRAWEESNSKQEWGTRAQNKVAAEELEHAEQEANHGG